MPIIQAEIKNMLSYNPDTGEFVWTNPSKYHLEKTGTRAGTIVRHKNGKYYERIGINGERIRSHRLAWIYIHGDDPSMIDHINGDSLDNRICNLREATTFQNTQNHISKLKKNGLPTGVSTTRKGYRARITSNKKVYHLGVFDNPEDAKIAYEKARNNLHDAPCRRFHGNS